MNERIIGIKTSDLEVVNERLHALLHGSSWWWDEFVIVNLDGTGGNLVQALKECILVSSLGAVR